MASGQVHGVLIEVDGCGVLISGPAGAGKSQLGLELISRGHAFVGDDAVQVERDGEQLSGQGLEECAEFLALRCGVVVNVARQFGPERLRTQACIDLVVSPGPALLPSEPIPQYDILGLRRPHHFLATLPGSAETVEALVRHWHDVQAGYDAAADLAARQAARLNATL